MLKNQLQGQIEACFSKAAGVYNKAAQVQKEAVGLLPKSYLPPLPEGRILEVGCGTGFMSEQLLAHYPHSNLLLTDLSQKMLAQAKLKFRDEQGVEFEVLDLEKLAVENQFQGIFSSFVLQWAADLSKSLQAMVKAVKPQGVVVAIIQGAGSYPEWKAACETLHLAFLGNPLPREQKLAQILKGQNYQLETLEIATKYPKAIDFFKELKLLGAATNLAGKSLDYKEFKALLAELDKGDPVTMTTQVIYVKVKKT